MTFGEAQRYIASFINFELCPPPRNISPFKLERMRRLLELLGQPQDHLRIIHVAGSKGKGSTCVFTATVLQKAGYKVGLYTSPHLDNYRERIRLMDLFCPRVHPPKADEEDIYPDMISEEDLCRTLEEMRPSVERLRREEELGALSFFELFTALAFCYFYRKQADFVVLETGMGGRLDATNTAPSEVCAITPVSLEHTAFLGSTIAQIAAEKGGIIKGPGPKVVIAPQEEEAREVLRARCAQFSIDPVFVGLDINWRVRRQGPTGQTIDIHSRGHNYPGLELPLAGEHQAVNAAVAVGIIESLRQAGVSLEDRAVYEGLRDPFWPGRLEIIQHDPLVVLDCAHTPASAFQLAETLLKIFPGKTAAVVLGVSEDKDRPGICRELNRITGCVVATRADHPRAYHFTRDELEAFFPGKACARVPDARQAVEYACRNSGPGNFVLVTGSVFLVGEARRYLLSKNGVVNKL
ncbi:MAG: bifunctional folylpolyglutamate synthase/dihydrofolate synthase [Candidatus Omnitrophica bacterium]|nr:bifunctional folylpolyglutamate synthase/dihydrofolate synthase [Candidatus Omnitrophota bacterium]